MNHRALISPACFTFSLVATPQNLFRKVPHKNVPTVDESVSPCSAPLSLEPALTFQSSATQIVFAPHCFLFPNSTGGKVDFENYFKAKGKVNPESGSRVGFHSQSRFSKKIIFF